MERWLPVENSDSYEVSDAGGVRRQPHGYVLRPTPDRKGYLCVTLMLKDGGRRTAKVHRLVCTAFIRPPEEGEQSNHKNGVKADNRAENLEWVTPSQNLQHAYDKGLKVQHCGERHGRAKLTDEQVRELRALKGKQTLNQLAAEYGVARNTVYLIHARKIWTHI